MPLRQDLKMQFKEIVNQWYRYPFAMVGDNRVLYRVRIHLNTDKILKAKKKMFVLYRRIVIFFGCKKKVCY